MKLSSFSCAALHAALGMACASNSNAVTVSSLYNKKQSSTHKDEEGQGIPTSEKERTVNTYVRGAARKLHHVVPSVKKVMVSLPGSCKILHLGEVELFAQVGGVDTNVALSANGGMASQSGTSYYSDSCAPMPPCGDAWRAIDGVTNTGYTHSDLCALNPWWEVVLNSTHDIERVKVWNRFAPNNSGCCRARLSGARVSLWDSDDNKIHELCLGSVAWNDPIEYDLDFTDDACPGFTLTHAPTSSPTGNPTMNPTTSPTGSDTFPKLAQVADNGKWLDNGPAYPPEDTLIGPGYLLGRCQGDCDGDDHCEEGLWCFHRCKDGHDDLFGCNANAPVPGCYKLPMDGTNPYDLTSGAEQNINAGEEDNGEDYCAPIPPGYPDDDGEGGKYLQLNTDNNPLADPPATKFGECQGDCNNDDDCEGTLECWKRAKDTRYVPVPGCTGLGERGADYCFDAETYGSQP